MKVESRKSEVLALEGPRSPAKSEKSLWSPGPSKPTRAAAAMNFFRQFWLLVWKNFLLQRRRKVCYARVCMRAVCAPTRGLAAAGEHGV